MKKHKKSTTKTPKQNKKLNNGGNKTKKRNASKMTTPYAQGTHGIITALPSNKNILVKSYKPCFTEANHEYNVQNILYQTFKNKGVKIKIPEATQYAHDHKNNTCSYLMKRVFKLNEETPLILVNMAEPETDRPFSHCAACREKGSGIINWKDFGFEDVNEAAEEIGRAFSCSHYVALLDAYDCELLAGKCGLWMIDFDKVCHLRFDDTFKPKRKTDEQTYQEFEASTPKRMASFLFSAMLSMSLVPTDPEQKIAFLKGYAEFKPDIENDYAVATYENVVRLVDEYELS